jgi:Kef-type K+ transport system membrane component KefB
MNVFNEFAIILTLAAFLGLILSKLKQPVLLGYILCGLILGPLTPGLNFDTETLELFSKIGITLLLFILGLELNIAELKHLGKVALTTGLGQIIFTSVIGYVISLALGFSVTASLYIAIALTFSSTIIIVKLLSQRNQLDTLFGKISTGFLLVQDFVAILLIIGLSAFGKIEGGSATVISLQLGITLLKGIGVAVGILVFTKYVLNPLLNWIKDDKDILFITVIAWAVALASLMGSSYIGFSIEIGGLLAGLALANRFEHLQIESWMKPLRDFFVSIFFILLGLHISVEAVGEVILPALLLSAFVLVGNPIIVILIMKWLGYSKKVSFMTSLAVAQISEFSLLVTQFGLDLGHVNNQELTLVTLIGGITMTLSTYLIYYNEQLYERLNKYLDIFRFKDSADSDDILVPNYEIVMFGCHRMGRNLLKMHPATKDKILIVDYDARIVKELQTEGYNAVFGDMNSLDMYAAYKIDTARTVISTVPMLKENKLLLQYISKLETKPLTIITANDDNSAKHLYEFGADFVVYPHMLGSHILFNIVRKGSLTKNMVKVRTKVIERLYS